MSAGRQAEDAPSWGLTSEARRSRGPRSRVRESRVEPDGRVTLTGRPAGAPKLAYARDSKSRASQGACGFDSHLRHHLSLCVGGRVRGIAFVRRPTMLPPAHPSPRRARSSLFAAILLSALPDAARRRGAACSPTARCPASGSSAGTSWSSTASSTSPSTRSPTRSGATATSRRRSSTRRTSTPTRSWARRRRRA